MSTLNPLIISGAQVQQFGDDINGYMDLTGDVDIYVSPSGNDTTGTGAIGAPYATLERAVEHFQHFVPGTNEINVHLVAGTHTRSTHFAMNYQYGGQVNWIGESDEGTATFEAFDTTATAFDTRLQWFDMDIVLTGATASVGDFILVRQAANGTNPGAVLGLHEVTAWDSVDTATVRVYQAVGTAELPSGAITSTDVVVIKTIITTTGANGLLPEKGLHLGAWDGVVIEGGNATSYTTFAGVFGRSGGRIDMGENVGVHNWRRGLRATDNSYVTMIGGGVSKCQDHGAVADTGYCAVNSSVHQPVISGCGLAGFQAIRDGLAVATITHFVAVATGVHAVRLGRITMPSSFIYFDGTNTVAALYGQILGIIDADNVTITGYATDADPATSPGADGSFIYQ